MRQEGSGRSRVEHRLVRPNHPVDQRTGRANEPDDQGHNRAERSLVGSQFDFSTGTAVLHPGIYAILCAQRKRSATYPIVGRRNFAR
jgi:hypothetical protein